jgi:hypothetical protein
MRPLIPLPRVPRRPDGWQSTPTCRNLAQPPSQRDYHFTDRTAGFELGVSRWHLRKGVGGGDMRADDTPAEQGRQRR